jgi:hypothetical protein
VVPHVNVYINECVTPPDVYSEVLSNQPYVYNKWTYNDDIDVSTPDIEYSEYDANNRFAILSPDLLSRADMYDLPDDDSDDISDVLTVKVLAVVTSMCKRITISKKFKKHVKGGSKRVVYLDTCADENLLNSANLFHNVCKSSSPIIVHGVNTNGSGLYVNVEGETDFGRGYYNSKSVGNILSFGKVKDVSHDVSYQKTDDTFSIQVKYGGPVYLFTRDVGLTNIYKCDLDKDVVFYPTVAENNDVISLRNHIHESDEDCRVRYVALSASVNAEASLKATKKCTIMSLTVRENRNKYTTRQNQQADLAREYQRKLGFSTEQMLIKLVNRGKLKHNKITAQDAMRSLDIHGPSLGGLKGKTTSHKSPVQAEIELIRSDVQPDQTMYSDLMFVNGRPFFVSVFLPSDFVQITRVKSKKEVHLLQVMVYHVRHVKNRGFKVPLIKVDGEGAMNTDFFKGQISKEVGTLLEACGSDEHISEIERKIRQIKELIRCVYNMLHFNVPSSLLDWLVKYAVSRIILLPTRNSEDYVSPREKIYGKIIDVDKELKHGFGDFVYVHPDGVDNTLNPRGHVGLALMPSGNATGSWVYMLLHNGETVIRGKVTNLPMTDEVILHLNTLAKKNKGKYPVNMCPVFDRGVEYHTIYSDEIDPTANDNDIATRSPEQNSIRHDDEGDELQVVLDTIELNKEDGYNDSNVDYYKEFEYVDAHIHNIYDENVDAHPIRENRPVEVDIDDPILYADIDVNMDNHYHAIVRTPAKDHRVPTNQDNSIILHDIFGDDSDDELNDVDNINDSLQTDEGVVSNDNDVALDDTAAIRDVPMSSEPNVVPENDFIPRRSTRNHQSGRWSTKVIGISQFRQSKRRYCMNMTVKQGLAQFGDVATDSIVKEMSQCVDKDVFQGEFYDQLSPEEKKSIITSNMFLKEKFLADGMFEKLKSRIIAGGHLQDREIYDNGSSPTIDTSSVFMLAAIAAAEHRCVATMDFPGAFLNGKMPLKGKHSVLMKLNKFLMGVLVKIAPEFAKFVRPDGTGVVRLKKALYGCVESARLWYEHLKKDLELLGFKCNPYDVCVFNRLEKCGSQTTLGIHVDDVMCTAGTEVIIDDLFTQLSAKYPGLVQKRGRVHNYLGMVFDFTVIGKAKITMPLFTGDFLEGVKDIEGVSPTPATNDLFKVKDVDISPLLCKSKRERFHSIVAQTLYLSKRVRPDLLTSVSFLTKRVLCAQDDDWNKLVRLIQYIRFTNYMGIVLEGTSLSVLAWIDSSFAVHTNMRGHTGIVVGVGVGPIYCRSVTQKLNTTSSTECELVGFADEVPKVLWVRNFMIEQGYKIGPSTVYQDNQSTMALVKNGRSKSERTRHIAIRYFFMADRVASGEISVEYMPTGDMLADILTKPLQGALFKRLRDRLLNWYTDKDGNPFDK